MVSITRESIHKCLDEQGMRCPVVDCPCDRVHVTAEPGGTDEPSKEHFTCTTCNTEWSAYLFASQIFSIMDGDTGYRYDSGTGTNEFSIERGVFDMLPCPKGPLAEVLKDFIKAMKFGSAQKKGEALAKLAHIVNVDLSSLAGTQLSGPQELPSDTV